MKPKQKIVNFLRWSQKYTKTDMVYLAKGGFWVTFGKIAALLLSLATMSAFSRWLSKESFGVFQYVISTVGIVAILTLPGMGQALIRTVAQGKEGMIWAGAKMKLKWSTLGSVLCFAVAFWYFSHDNLVLTYSFVIAGAFLPFTRMFNVLFSFWQGKKRFDIQAKLSMFINFGEAAFLVTAIFLTDNLILILGIYFVSRTLFRAICFAYTQKRIQNKEKDTETLPFGKHLTLMQALGTFAAKIDKIIIWQFLGPVSVAIYSFAQVPIQQAAGIVPIGSLALPKLSQQDIGKIKKELLQKFLKFFLFTIPFAAIFALLIPYVFRILFPEYLESIAYARALSLTFVLLPFGLLQTALVANAKTKQLYLIQIIGPILKIALFFSLIPLYGIWGIIAATLIAQIIGGLLTLYLFKKA